MAITIPKPVVEGAAKPRQQKDTTKGERQISGPFSDTLNVYYFEAGELKYNPTPVNWITSHKAGTTWGGNMFHLVLPEPARDKLVSIHNAMTFAHLVELARARGNDVKFK